MTNIIMEDMGKKIVDMITNNFTVNYYRHDLRLFACVTYGSKIIHKEYLDIFKTVEELEETAKVLADTFDGKYMGEINE